MDIQLLTEEEIEAEIKLLDSIVWNDDFTSSIIPEQNDNEEDDPQIYDHRFILTESSDQQTPNNSDSSCVQFYFSQSLLTKWNAQAERSFTYTEEIFAHMQDWNMMDSYIEEPLRQIVLLNSSELEQK